MLSRLINKKFFASHELIRLVEILRNMDIAIECEWKNEKIHKNSLRLPNRLVTNNSLTSRLNWFLYDGPLKTWENLWCNINVI